MRELKQCLVWWLGTHFLQSSTKSVANMPFYNHFTLYQGCWTIRWLKNVMMTPCMNLLCGWQCRWRPQQWNTRGRWQNWPKSTRSILKSLQIEGVCDLGLQHSERGAFFSEWRGTNKLATLMLQNCLNTEKSDGWIFTCALLSNINTRRILVAK